MSTRTLTTHVLAALCALTLMLTLTPSQASAGVTHHYLSQITEVPAGPGITSGPLNTPFGLAIDSGNLYVADPGAGVVDEFNPKNELVQQFPAEGSNIAINHATDEIYTSTKSEIHVFSATGTPLGSWTGQDTPNRSFTANFSEIKSIAVDNTPAATGDPAAGDVYVADITSLEVFKPEGGEKEKYVTSLPFGEGAEITTIAVDPASGNVIVYGAEKEITFVKVFKPKAPGVYEYLLELERPVFGSRQFSAIRGIAVNGATGDIYISNGAADSGASLQHEAVYQYSASGAYLYEFAGTPSAEFTDGLGILAGVAVGPNGNVYVAESQNNKVIDIFGPDIPTPDVTTTQPSKAGGVTINGTVNPNGTPIVKCEFEYGPTSSYGSMIPCSALPSGTSPKQVMANLSALSPHTIYHYRLVATDEEGFTNYGQDVPLYTAPVVDSSALVSNITSFAATLTGLIEPGAITPSYHFVYGTTSAYGSIWPQTDATTGTGGQQPVVQTLTGLQPGTTYHFALIATNFGGFETIGPDQTFTTRPLVPPAVNTGGLEAIGQTTATLTGAVNPEGLPTTYRFEYGPTTAYGSTWPLVQVFAGTGSTAQGVAVAVPNLKPGAGYHYRLIATNEDGTTYGPDQSFTTPAYPVSIVQEPTTLPTVKAPAAKAKKAPVKKKKKKKPAKKKKKTKAKKK